MAENQAINCLACVAGGLFGAQSKFLAAKPRKRAAQPQDESLGRGGLKDSLGRLARFPTRASFYSRACYAGYKLLKMSVVHSPGSS